MKRHQSRTYQTTESMTCAGCKGEIKPGGHYKKDRAGTPWHPACKRLGVRTKVNERPRYQFDNPVGQECPGCGTKIGEGEAVVHVSAKPWHTECKQLFAR